VVDQSAVGVTGEPFEMDVERGKVREFAKSVMSNHPGYHQDENPVSPPTFLMAMSFFMPPGSSPFSKVKLDMRRVLHGEQEFIFHGPPPRAGTHLTAQTRVSEVYEKEGKRGGTMTFLVTVTEFRDDAGTLVAETRSTAIETGKPPSEA
jgi:hypothetical protein